MGKRSLLVTAATDGSVILWDVSNLSLNVVIKRWKIHQSGVKAMHIIVDNKTVFIATGGDDAAVSVLKLEMSEHGGISSESIFRNLSSHISSVTGCVMPDPFTLYSMSVDQKLNKYEIKNNCLLLVDTVILDIADAGDLSFSRSDSSLSVAIVGHGIQVFSLSH
jgi:WD40 repeat protein